MLETSIFPLFSRAGQPAGRPRPCEHPLHEVDKTTPGYEFSGVFGIYPRGRVPPPDYLFYVRRVTLGRGMRCGVCCGPFATRRRKMCCSTNECVCCLPHLLFWTQVYTNLSISFGMSGPGIRWGYTQEGILTLDLFLPHLITPPSVWGACLPRLASLIFF